jgi:ABC-type lipoprotein release transport system permease subunit
MLAHLLALKSGDAIELEGHSFTIADTLAETGTEEDLWIFLHLSDAQQVLRRPGRINEIRALDCECNIPGVDPIDILRTELAQVFPEAKLFQISSIAKAREQQRRVVDNYFALLMPILLIGCGIWIAALALQNTRDRRNEIGVLRALGYPSGTIAALFLGRSIVIGAVGALAGFAIGTALALTYGPDIFQATAKHIQPIYAYLGWSILLAPLFAAVSSFIPAMMAVAQDPAEILRDA